MSKKRDVALLAYQVRKLRGEAEGEEQPRERKPAAGAAVEGEDFRDRRGSGRRL
jgi:hypothetical protein